MFTLYRSSEQGKKSEMCNCIHIHKKSLSQLFFSEIIVDCKLNEGIQRQHIKECRMYSGEP